MKHYGERYYEKPAYQRLETLICNTCGALVTDYPGERHYVDGAICGRLVPQGTERDLGRKANDERMKP